jgi:hypothetical protein
MKRRSTLLALLVTLWILAARSSAWGAAGDLLWQKSFNFLTGYDMIFPAVTFSSTCCIVSGQALKSDYSIAPLGFIKVFDMATGDLKWERTLNDGESDNYFSDIVINGNTISMQSYSGSYTNSYDPETRITTRIYGLNHTILGSYDANAGTPLWEQTRDNFSGNLVVQPAAPQESSRVVFVGVQNPSGFGPSGDCIVSVYQAKNANMAAVNSLLLKPGQ